MENKNRGLNKNLEYLDKYLIFILGARGLDVKAISMKFKDSGLRGVYIPSIFVQKSNKES